MWIFYKFTKNTKRLYAIKIIESTLTLGINDSRRPGKRSIRAIFYFILYSIFHYINNKQLINYWNKSPIFFFCQGKWNKHYQSSSTSHSSTTMRQYHEDQLDCHKNSDYKLLNQINNIKQAKCHIALDKMVGKILTKIS